MIIFVSAVISYILLSIFLIVYAGHRQERNDLKIKKALEDRVAELKVSYKDLLSKGKKEEAAEVMKKAEGIINDLRDEFDSEPSYDRIDKAEANCFLVLFFLIPAILPLMIACGFFLA